MLLVQAFTGDKLPKKLWVSKCSRLRTAARPIIFWDFEEENEEEVSGKNFFQQRAGKRRAENEF